MMTTTILWAISSIIWSCYLNDDYHNLVSHIFNPLVFLLSKWWLPQSCEPYLSSSGLPAIWWSVRFSGVLPSAHLSNLPVLWWWSSSYCESSINFLVFMSSGGTALLFASPQFNSLVFLPSDDQPTVVSAIRAAWWLVPVQRCCFFHHYEVVPSSPIAEFTSSRLLVASFSRPPPPSSCPASRVVHLQTIHSPCSVSSSFLLFKRKCSKFLE